LTELDDAFIASYLQTEGQQGEATQMLGFFCDSILVVTLEMEI